MFNVIYDYDTVMNGFAVEVEYQYLEQIQKIDGIKNVFIENVYALPEPMGDGATYQNSDVLDMIGAKDTAFKGDDMVIAVIDSGLATDHEAFAVDGVTDKLTKGKVSDVVSDLQASKRSGDLNADKVRVNAKIPFAYDYADRDTDVKPKSESDHGTHVAGIASANGGETVRGVAPNAQVVSLKVFADNSGNAEFATKYTEATRTALETSLNDAVLIANPAPEAKGATQEEVDQAVTALLNAIKGLLLEGTTPGASVENDELVNDDFGNNDFQNIDLPKIDDSDLIVKEDDTLTPEDIENKTDIMPFPSVPGGNNDLVLVSFDKLEAATDDDKIVLKALIEIYDTLQESDYIADTWTSLKEAIISASMVNANPAATKEQVAEQVNALLNAMAGLQGTPNKEALKLSVQATENLSKSAYTAETWKVLEEKLDAVKAVVNDVNASQEEINTASKDLNTALAGLKIDGGGKPTDPNNPGGENPQNPHGYTDGSYKVSISAKNLAGGDSMLAQFLNPSEDAGMEVSGERITISFALHGTKDIQINKLKKLEYQLGGNWKSASLSHNTADDKVVVSMELKEFFSSLPMRVTVDGMGDPKEFTLAFGTPSKGRADVGGAGQTLEFIIKAEAEEGGIVSPKGDVKVKKGANQTFTIQANEGYRIKDVLVDGVSQGIPISYTFENVEKAHTLKATFERSEGMVLFDEETKQDTNLEKEMQAIVMEDIGGHWGERGIRFALAKGLFAGTSETKFSPELAMTRGMYVAVLGRMHKVDTKEFTETTFTDVPKDAYFAPYVAWAAQNKIVAGMGEGLFAPDAEITREQAATMFYNYQKYAGLQKNKAEGDQMENGSYTVSINAKQETQEEASMAAPFITEPATIQVSGEKKVLTMKWNSTEAVSMNMIQELKYKNASGEFVAVAYTASSDGKSMTFSVPLDNTKEVLLQVYAPAGMGESKPVVRLVLKVPSRELALETKVQSALGQRKVLLQCKALDCLRETKTAISIPRSLFLEQRLL